MIVKHIRLCSTLGPGSAIVGGAVGIIVFLLVGTNSVLSDNERDGIVGRRTRKIEHEIQIDRGCHTLLAFSLGNLHVDGGKRSGLTQADVILLGLSHNVAEIV